MTNPISNSSDPFKLPVVAQLESAEVPKMPSFQIPAMPHRSSKRLRELFNPTGEAPSSVLLSGDDQADRANSGPSPFKKAASASSVLFSPAAEGFRSTDHRERDWAVNGFLPKAPPPTPRGKTARSLQPALPFIQNARDVRTLMQQAMEEIKAQTFVPFDLEVAPGVVKKITSVASIPSIGQHSAVFKCSVEGEGDYVLKILNEEILARRGEAVSCVASQLWVYWQNMRNDVLKDHCVPHLNFDPHLRDLDDRHLAKPPLQYGEVRQYVEKHLQKGFLFSKFIPNPFPRQFDQTASPFIQLNKMFVAGTQSAIENDIRIANVLLDEQERVWLIDLYERCDGSGDGFGIDLTEQARTFTSDPEQQKWLITDHSKKQEAAESSEGPSDPS